jgi:hypothetical protein
MRGLLTPYLYSTTLQGARDIVNHSFDHSMFRSFLLELARPRAPVPREPAGTPRVEAGATPLPPHFPTHARTQIERSDPRIRVQVFGVGLGVFWDAHCAMSVEQATIIGDETCASVFRMRRSCRRRGATRVQSREVAMVGIGPAMMGA